MSKEFTNFEIDLDLSETPDWGGEYSLVPPGDYLLTIVGFEQKNAKSSNNPMIAVTFEIAEGEYQGQKVFNNYSLSVKAQGRIKRLMLACKTETNRIVAEQFQGATIRGTVIHTEGQGSVDSMGNAQAPRMFANVINEMPLEDAAPQEQPATKTKANTPPIVAGKQASTATKPAGNSAARRT